MLKVLMLLVIVAMTLLSDARAADRGPLIDPGVLNEFFLSFHPDLDGRIRGMRAYTKGEYAKAFRLFQHASRYGDKPSQGMVADMYWDGLGVARDRALGYAWMDLAAERGYPQFVVFRDRYWAELDERARRDAVARGQAVYAEYRDSVAKPRLDRLLRRGRAQQTGTRTGSTTTRNWIEFKHGSVGGVTLVRANELYAPKYWEPERYWQLQDEVWSRPARARVTVGDLLPGADRVQDAEDLEPEREPLD